MPTTHLIETPNEGGQGLDAWPKTGGAMAIAGALSACGGGSGGDDKLIHVQFKIDSVTQDGVCEHVSVQATPKNLAPGQGSMSATKMFYTEIDMKQVKEGEVACAGEAQSSRPLGTGVWEFKVRLASGPSICEHQMIRARCNECMTIKTLVARFEQPV